MTIFKVTEVYYRQNAITWQVWDYSTFMIQKDIQWSTSASTYEFLESQGGNWGNFCTSSHEKNLVASKIVHESSNRDHTLWLPLMSAPREATRLTRQSERKAPYTLLSHCLSRSHEVDPRSQVFCFMSSILELIKFITWGSIAYKWNPDLAWQSLVLYVNIHALQDLDPQVTWKLTSKPVLLTGQH